MVTIQLFSKSNGKPVSNTKVRVYEKGHGVYHEYTDSNGEAHFSSLSPCEGDVYVDGDTVYTGRLEGRTIVYS